MRMETHRSRIPTGCVRVAGESEQSGLRWSTGARFTPWASHRSWSGWSSLFLALGLMALGLGVDSARAADSAQAVSTLHLTAYVHIPDGTLDGPDCTPVPYTVNYTKSGDPHLVSGTVKIVFAQQGSNAFGEASSQIAAQDPATGSTNGQLAVCADRFRGEANKVDVSLLLVTTVGSETESANAAAGFYVGRARTAVRDFRATSSTVGGSVKARTKRFGEIGAEGRAVVWYRAPGKKLFTRLGSDKLDQFGRFQVATNGRVPAGSRLKVNSSGCSWCQDAYAEASLKVVRHKAPRTRYYKSNWYPGYVAVQFKNGGAKVQAVFQGDGPGWCFVGRRHGAGVYRGVDYTFGVGTRSATYMRSDITGGQRVSPPGWFKSSSARAFRRSQCR